jgi:inorganic pyrophosphatase
MLSSRPVGVLFMEDETGFDEKIIAVPTSKLTQRYDVIRSYTDLPRSLSPSFGTSSSTTKTSKKENG